MFQPIDLVTCTGFLKPAVVYTSLSSFLSPLSYDVSLSNPSPTPLYNHPFPRLSLQIPPLALSENLSPRNQHRGQPFMDTTATKRPCFVEEDDGLASIADMESGFSLNHHNHHPFFSRPLYNTASQRRNSLRSLSFPSASSPRSARFYHSRFEDQQPHFLEACFLCKKPLGDNRDIFMYRGDTPFCSEECRQEQIEMDEAKEKNRNLSASMKALRKKEQKKSTSPKDYPFHTGAMAAA